MIKVLFLCPANTCRSPMAAGILKKKAKENNINIYVDSAGFETFHIGDPPDKHALEISQKFGADISDHRARLFSTKDFDTFDKIYIMDQKTYHEINYFITSANQQKKLTFMMDLVESGPGNSIPDPFLAEAEACEYVYNILEQACETLINQLKKEEQKK
ncbi:MAG: low molecular weight phosphotyrosine protein phosphatase [Bacteroidales bacterium]|nr:low molecular weight phosphotyrosine protein phosphatase [Bacteroidales bacterium]MCF8338006.1 low molecular weight phosphotyrosine protein phosphatase [Bacteroidales bacterium]